MGPRSDRPKKPRPSVSLCLYSCFTYGCHLLSLFQGKRPRLSSDVEDSDGDDVAFVLESSAILTTKPSMPHTATRRESVRLYSLLCPLFLNFYRLIDSRS